MTADNESRLRRLLNAGKINQEEYQQLRENLPNEPTVATAAPSPPPPPPPHATYQTMPTASSYVAPVPWQVWFCFGFLILASLLTLFGANSKNMAVVLTTALLNTALGFGLLARWKWVFIGTLGLAVLAVLGCLFKGLLIAALLNTVFFLILLFAWSHFFPDQQQR